MSVAGPHRQSAGLDELSALDHGDFVGNAYRVILGRPPTAAEHDRMLAALLRGDTKTWLLGTLRYADEGNARGVSIAGLRLRYMAQRLFRVPVIGPLFEWLNAIVRLPRALRHFRAVAQADSIARTQDRETDRARLSRVDTALDRFTRESERVDHTLERLASESERLARETERLASESERLASESERLARETERLARETEQIAREADRLAGAHETVAALAQQTQARLDDESIGLDAIRSANTETRSRIDAIATPVLDDTLEVRGSPLAALARERAGIPPTTAIEALSPHARYALFETVFYESPAVAAKQRVYLPYIERDLARRLPFLDLGCGRGEFLHILREEGIATVGVDRNPFVLAPLRAAGFDVVEQDLLQFLEHDARRYCGASILQVAEHLTGDQIERMLVLVAERLVSGAVLIVETPNPLSPFALGVFHTDPTHVTPLPPERLRYAIEAAGFEDSRTLFQARIPQGQFAGPDPRAYYADYAVIARRSGA